MSDHELLVKLAKQGRQRQILLTVMAAAVLITSIIVVYAVFNIMPKVSETAALINELNPKVTEAVETVTKMANDCSSSVQKIDRIDIDELNSAISDFSKIVGTLAALFGK